MSVRATIKPDTVENIQALRGIAALLVAWAHLKFALPLICPQCQGWSIITTDYGAIGVDLFFVISGYVICLTACKKHHQPLDFFLARIARVAPPYLVITLIFLWSAMPFHLLPHPGLISLWNGVFYLPLFDFGSFTGPPVMVGWTLSFEMWFYTVFALLLNFGKPARVALALPLFFLAGAVLMTPYQGSWYFPRLMFHPFVLEFALGCLLYHTQNWVRGKTPYALLFAGVLYFIVFDRNNGYLGGHGSLLNDRIDLAWMRVFLWGFPCALIAAGLVGLEKNDNIVLPRALVWLGGISYSMYLTHRLTYRIVDKLCLGLNIHNAALACAALIAGAVLVGWLCWKYLEKPLTTRAQRWAKNLAAPQPNPVPSTATSA